MKFRWYKSFNWLNFEMHLLITSILKVLVFVVCL